ncbi:MAG: prolyl oligopeptidase family serine peptidase [Roseiflexaceae bacterium]
MSDSNNATTLLRQEPLELDAASLAALAERDPALPGELATVSMATIAYRSDGLTIAGALVQPRAPGRYPCLIYNRGGTGEGGALGPDEIAGTLAKIASWSYVVVASQYRGGPGSEGTDEFGGSDLADVLALFPLLDNLPAADTSRIGMWGWSRGGLMTYRAVASTSRIAAAVIVAGVADAFDYMARRPDMEQEVFSRLIANYRPQRLMALTIRSAIRWPDMLYKHTPLLLVHGSADRRVHPGQSLRMAAALHEHSHPFRLLMLEGGDHALSEYRTELFATARAWLDRYVRDRLPWPSLEPHGV